MSAARPRRAAAADADWLIRQRKELIELANSASTSAASHLPLDSDDDDESYVPTSAASNKRQRTAAGPLHSASEPPPSATAFSTSTHEGSGGAEYDIWDEHEQDTRHQRSRATGCFVIAPIVKQPHGYRSEQAAREAERAQQTAESEQKQSSGSKPSQRGKRASTTDVAPSTIPTTPPAVGPLTLLPSGVTALTATEPLSAVLSRDTALTESLEALSVYMSSLLSTSHQSTFAAIGEWIASLPPPASYNSLNCLTPSAFLYAGVDADDQPLLFSELSSHILDRPSSASTSAASSSSSPSTPFCLPLLVSASQCQTVERAVRHILVSYMLTYPSSTTSSARARRSDHNAHFLYSLEQSAARQKQLTKELWPSLAEWWKDKCSSGTADSDQPPRLVLIFTEPQAIAPATLSRLLYVLMCHEQLRQLPWVWMFGLGVDARVMYGLDERVTSRMRVANFRLATSSTLLSPLLASLLLSPSATLPLPLLSPSTLRYLVLSFASNHTSLSSFALALRALVCDYYSSVPFSGRRARLADRQSPTAPAVHDERGVDGNAARVWPGRAGWRTTTPRSTVQRCTGSECWSG